MVTFPFYFNKEKIVLPLKCDFKIQEMVESLASFLALRFSVRAHSLRVRKALTADRMQCFRRRRKSHFPLEPAGSKNSRATASRAFLVGQPVISLG